MSKGYSKGDIISKRHYSNGVEKRNFSATIFDNLPELITLELAAKVLKKSRRTFYDWKYRGQTRKNKVPENLFQKIGGSLYLRKSVLLQWSEVSNQRSL